MSTMSIWFTLSRSSSLNIITYLTDVLKPLFQTSHTGIFSSSFQCSISSLFHFPSMHDFTLITFPNCQKLAVHFRVNAERSNYYQQFVIFPFTSGIIPCIRKSEYRERGNNFHDTLFKFWYFMLSRSINLSHSSTFRHSIALRFPKYKFRALLVFPWAHYGLQFS